MGNFGVTKVQYSNYMRCNWNIQVNSSDVGCFKMMQFLNGIVLKSSVFSFFLCNDSITKPFLVGD